MPKYKSPDGRVLDGSPKCECIPGYDGKYLICDNGDVISLKRNIILKHFKDKKGYHYVSLCRNGKYRRFLVHRLVADAFCDKKSAHPAISEVEIWRVKAANTGEHSQVVNTW